MRFIFRFAPFLILLFIAEGVYAQNLQGLINQAKNQEAFWSVTVRNSKGDVLEEVNSEKLIIPASNQKLFTTAAILDYLGSDYRFQTIIYGDGDMTATTWEGDIILKGSGDPSISGDLYNDDRYHVFKQFLNQLKEKGIHRISGNMAADLSLFDDQPYPKGWDWYDFSFYYGVQINPLSFNNNTVDLEVFAEGKIGDTPRISWFPEQTDYIHFENKQVITHPSIKYDEYYRRGLGDNQIVLGSTLPQGYVETEALSVDDPAMFFLDSFKDYLFTNGIQVEGSLTISSGEKEVDSLQILAVHQSKPFSELIKWANKESDNFYVEMFLKKLSAEKSKMSGTFEDGISQVRNFLAGEGIDTTFVIMNDGSGLASGNFTTTEVISELLFKMQEHKEFGFYRKSLPVAGIDGSLSYRMKGTNLQENFIGKTGYVSGVRTLSGYLKTRSGDTIIVSMATNHFAGKVRPVDKTHEEILQYLYESY